MSLTGSIIKFATRKSARRFEQASRDPLKVQQEKLLGMVQRNADTEYGRRYGFDSIRSIADYQNQVPVIAYEDIRADMERVINGAKKVFTAEDPVMFAQTSGTTGTPKYVPVTPTCQGPSHSDVMRTWLYHAALAHPDIFDRQIVSLISPAVEGYSPSGLPFGSTSGMMYKDQSWLVKTVYCIPYEVFEIDDYQAKYYAIMRIALERDVNFVATANPSSILKLIEKADDFSETLIRDIRDGTLSGEVEIGPDIRQHIGRRLKRNPRRAQALEAMRQRRDGTLKPGDYWPNMSLIGCWKGGTVGHYLDKFVAWFDPDGRRPVPVRDWGYLSSEARGSIPLSDEGSQGALTITSNFFEFVAVDDLAAKPGNPSAWRFLTVGELEQGREYYIFVTTTGGLYRYDINDVIRVEGYYHRNPEIVFLRKGRGMTNITGEKVSVNQIISAIQAAAGRTGAVPDHFKAEADTDNSRYIFKVEFTRPVDEATLKAFLSATEQQLRTDNIEYQSKRDSARLKPPLLQVMREGWYERERRQLVAGGRRAFQAKTELLSPMRAPTAVVRPELEKVVELGE